MMPVKPIQHSDLSYQAYLRIKEMILGGELKPGEKIVQEKIAESLGVSRMPLHKAFQMLEDELLVCSIPRRGIFIRETDLLEILEAFECREGLEGVAARRTAMTMAVSEIRKLRKTFLEFREKKQTDALKYQKADLEFHEAIIRASGNRVLQKLNNVGNVLIRTYKQGIFLSYDESISDHLGILDAIENRDPVKTEELIRLHSRKARDHIERQIMDQKKQKEQ
jgi:DNA-binding GntR family transcriptional regulator